jgi:hypothetical protein
MNGNDAAQDSDLAIDPDTLVIVNLVYQIFRGPVPMQLR